MQEIRASASNLHAAELSHSDLDNSELPEHFAVFMLWDFDVKAKPNRLTSKFPYRLFTQWKLMKL